MRPITGGTTNSPPYASTEISEAAAAELTPSRRPARLKRSGTTGESPAPGSAKAARQKTGFSQKQSIKPAAAAVRLPPVISTPSVRRRRRSSPTRRQTTAAAAKAAKAGAAASNPAQKQGAPLGRCTFRCIRAGRHEPEDPDNRRKLETSFGPLFCRMRSCIVNEPGVSTKSTKSVKSRRHRSHFRHL